MPDKGRLFFLDIGQDSHPVHGRVLSANTDGSDLKTIVDNIKTAPDGIAMDHEKKHIWWTNMGASIASDGSSYENDGSISRCDIDGSNLQTIIPVGETHTPKQCIIAPKSNKLYWCDREGMRVMRSNLDGSEIETLVISGTDMKDSQNWCVGIAVDEKNKKFYWTQKGAPKGNQGRIFRAGLELPAGDKPNARSDVEVLFENLPEPIDLEFDEDHETLYWTDRGDESKGGNSVNRTSVGSKANSTKLEKTILVENLHEGIGLALDMKNKRMFFGDLKGSVYEADLDGSNEKAILHDMGNTTGIALVNL